MGFMKDLKFNGTNPYNSTVIQLEKILNGTKCFDKDGRLDISNLDLSHIEINIPSAFLNYVNFSNSKIGTINLCDANLDNAIFDNTYIEKAIFKNCSMNNASFKNSVIKIAAFRRCSCSRADFSNAILGGSDFYRCNLYKTNFSNASLDNASLRHSRKQEGGAEAIGVPLGFKSALVQPSC